MTRAGDTENPCTRWLVLVACFVCHMTTASVSYHAGVLHVALMDTFQQDVIATAWLCSVYSSLPSLIGPVASLIITTFDCRVCLILSGVLAAVGTSSCFFITNFYLFYPALILAGIGQGFSLVASYVAIGYNFPYQASLLTGICVCGSGLGIFIHPPLLQKLVDYFGVNGALLILGAISLNSVACGLAIPPSSYEKQRKLARKHSTGDVTLKPHSSIRSLYDVLRDFRFLLLLVTSFGFSSALACYYIYLPDFLLRNHYDHLTASFVLSATGMGSIPARLLTGVASNDVNIESTTFFFGIHALAAVATFLVPCTVNSVAAQMILAVLFGIYTGSVWASYSPFLLELLGVRRVADGVGLYLFTMGIGYISGPPLAGNIYTLSNNFHHVFYYTGAMFAVASAATMMSVLVRPKEDPEPQPLHGQNPNKWRQSMETSMEVAVPALQVSECLLSPEENTHSVVIMAEINRGDNAGSKHSLPELPPDTSSV
ncbi:hypothetical protein ACOMHN_044971 [Nucella lapillus]